MWENDYTPQTDYDHILDLCRSDDDTASPECREAVYEILDNDNLHEVVLATI